jgi:hypothetical protein
MMKKKTDWSRHVWNFLLLVLAVSSVSKIQTRMSFPWLSVVFLVVGLVLLYGETVWRYLHRKSTFQGVTKIVVYGKPNGQTVLIDNSGYAFHWNVLKIGSSDQQGYSEVRLEIEIYPGIDLVKEAVKLFKIANMATDSRGAFLAVLDLMTNSMTADESLAYFRQIAGIALE